MDTKNIFNHKPFIKKKTLNFDLQKFTWQEWRSLFIFVVERNELLRWRLRPDTK